MKTIAWAGDLGSLCSLLFHTHPPNRITGQIALALLLFILFPVYSTVTLKGQKGVLSWLDQKLFYDCQHQTQACLGAYVLRLCRRCVFPQYTLHNKHSLPAQWGYILLMCRGRHYSQSGQTAETRGGNVRDWKSHQTGEGHRQQREQRAYRISICCSVQMY